MIDPALPGGKYAAYIWPAYVISALGFAWMILDTLLRARHWRRRTRTLEDDRHRDD